MPPKVSENVTQLLIELSNGDREAVDLLLPVIYDELRKLAANYLRRERPDHTLQPTALVHEAYLRLVDQTRVNWQNRAHFFGVAAQIMRRLLVDHARRHNAEKRGQDFQKLSLDENIDRAVVRSAELMALDDALKALAVFDPQKARVVELRYFGGLSIEETADVLGVTGTTIKRHWRFAKAWLHGEMQKALTPERWRQVEEIFQAALDLGPQDRARYVSEACADDAVLQRDVEALLSQHESAGELLEDPLYGDTQLSALEAFAYEDEDPLIGRRLGAYRIEREIGRGGMGAVYEAVRVDNEFVLRVAIKLVKRGMDTDFVLRRFRKERQILAALDHPHIARLLDGGTTADGLPYFVMEFIEGQPLYRYCDTHHLPIAERLKLFRSLCDAVQYAHQKQVVHRDIKPSNVLVTSEGIPKLLDFGIAKLLNPALAGDITHDPTATAMRLMTPEYASPEQVQGAAATPTTDVYSLGVLLYELLTGHRPYRLAKSRTA